MMFLLEIFLLALLFTKLSAIEMALVERLVMLLLKVKLWFLTEQDFCF